MRNLLPLLGFLLLSCGQMQPGDDPAQGARPLQEQSGTRLKRVFLVADDGTQAALWFHDTKLGIDCGFQQTATGWRCLPTTGAPKLSMAEYVGAESRISP